MGRRGLRPLTVYLLPTVVAAHRRSDWLWPAAAINLLLGWSLVGWVVALVLASTEERPGARAGHAAPRRAFKQRGAMNGAPSAGGRVKRREPALELDHVVSRSDAASNEAKAHDGVLATVRERVRILGYDDAAGGRDAGRGWRTAPPTPTPGRGRFGRKHGEKKRRRTRAHIA